MYHEKIPATGIANSNPNIKAEITQAKKPTIANNISSFITPTTITIAPVNNPLNKAPKSHPGIEFSPFHCVQFVDTFSL